MDKREIFDKIAEVSAEVCNVSMTDVFNGVRREDVVFARAIFVFWSHCAGFSVESIMRYAEVSSPNTINQIKGKIETYWISRYVFHVLLREAGEKLRKYAVSIGEDFDMERPLRHLSRVTGKY